MQALLLSVHLWPAALHRERCRARPALPRGTDSRAEQR